MAVNQFEERQRKNQSTLRMIYDFTMGLLWTAIGVFLLTYRKFGLTYNFDPLLTNIFGGVCIGYGLFRLWRAYKAKSGNA